MQELLVPLGSVGGVLLLASLTAGLVERGPISFPIVFLGAGILVVRHLRALGREAHALIGGLEAWEVDGHPTSVLDTTFRGPPTVDTPQ